MKLTAGFPKVSARFYEINHHKLDDFPVAVSETKKIKYRLMTYMPKTTKTLRLYAKIRAWEYPRIYIRVWYGLLKTNKGKTKMFYNDAIIDNREEALRTLRDFLE